MPGHMGSDGNEIAYQLARHCSSHTLRGPELALGISVKVVKGVMSNWTNKHRSIGSLYMNESRLSAYLKPIC